MMDGGASPSMAHSYVSPLLISMLGIVVTTTAIMVYHLILVKYCIRRHAANAAPPQPAVEAAPTGVDEKVLVEIPILAFAVVKRGIDQGECVVCLGELEDEDAVRLLPNCNHAFHVSCIDQWFAEHTNCPLCRLPVYQEQPIESPATHDLPAAVDPNRGESSENQATDDTGPSPPLSMEQPIRILSHCVSLVTPLPAAMEQGSWTRLKRSLSMDQSAVVIDLQRANCSNTTSLSSSPRGILIRSGSSLSHFERVPSNWRMSFSTWFRAGKAPNGSILPY